MQVSNSILNISSFRFLAKELVLSFGARLGTSVWTNLQELEDNGIEISHSVIKKVVELKTEVARNTFLKMLIDEGRSIFSKKINDLFRLCGDHTSEKLCSNSDFFPTDSLYFPF